jgi:hypothetical protein
VSNHNTDDERPEERARRAETALAAALEERTALWDEAHRARALDVELAEVRKMIDEMQASASWRLTAPLRQAKGSMLRYRVLAKRARARLSAGR